MEFYLIYIIIILAANSLFFFGKTVKKPSQYRVGFSVYYI